jgi:hypothetical protein
MTRHSPAIANRTEAYARYHYKNWSMEYGCPECGRRGWFSKNFLGQRKVVCDGVKFHKVSMTLGELRKAGLDVQEVIKALERNHDPVREREYLTSAREAAR